MPEARIWLDVPYQDKDNAKKHGAHWDAAARRWYAPRAGMDGLKSWEALPDVPDPLPGEDRSFGTGLFVDLVPSSCWFTNVRSCVDRRDWERLRRMVLKRANSQCEACRRGEDRQEQRWLEVHERWSFDDRTLVQTLRRLICLCTDCHRTTHFGLAQVRGQSEQAFAHLRTVTGMSELQADQHVHNAFALWERRSHSVWALDLGMLTGANITVVRPPDAASRARTAEATLRTQR